MNAFVRRALTVTLAAASLVLLALGLLATPSRTLAEDTSIGPFPLCTLCDDTVCPAKDPDVTPCGDNRCYGNYNCDVPCYCRLYRIPTECRCLP